MYNIKRQFINELKKTDNFDFLIKKYEINEIYGLSLMDNEIKKLFINNKTTKTQSL